MPRSSQHLRGFRAQFILDLLDRRRGLDRCIHDDFTERVVGLRRWLMHDDNVGRIRRRRIVSSLSLRLRCIASRTRM